MIVAQYNTLSPEVKRMVDLLAYACCPIKKTSFIELRGTLKMSTSEMTSALDKLGKLNAFVIYNNSYWDNFYELNPLFALEHLAFLVKNGRDLKKEVPNQVFWAKVDLIVHNLRDVLIGFLKEGKISCLSGIDIDSVYADGLCRTLLRVDAFKGGERILPPGELLCYFREYMFLKTHYFDKNSNIEERYSYLVDACSLVPDFQWHLRDTMALLNLLEGKWNLISGKIDLESEFGCYLNGMRVLYGADYALAVKYFEKGIKLGKENAQDILPLYPIFNFGYAMALILSDNPKHLAKIVTLYGKKCIHEEVFFVIPRILFAIKLGKRVEEIQEAAQAASSIFPMNLFALLCRVIEAHFGLNLNIPLPTLANLMEEAGSLGFRLLQLEGLSVMPEREGVYQDLTCQLGMPGVLSRVRVVPEWEKVLDTLLVSKAVTGTGAATDKRARVVYFVNTTHYFVQPVLQQSKDGVTWTAGRNIALKRMATGGMDGMTDVDRLVAQCISKEAHYYGADDYELDHEAALAQLVGHPNLFLSANPSISVEVVEMLPELILTKERKGYMMRSNVKDTELAVQVIRETETRLKVLKLSVKQRQVLNTFKRLSYFPESAKDKLLQLLKQLNGVLTIHSDLFEQDSTLKTVVSDSRIVVQLLPVGETLRAELFVKPFGACAPYCKVGSGAQTVIGMMDNERCQAIRDLKLEASNLQQVLPEVERTATAESGTGSYIYESPESCLELLELLKMREEFVVTEWPEGVKYKVRSMIGCGNFNISMKAKNQWFEMEGSVKVGDEVLMTMKELMDGMRGRQGRFVPLGNGEFVALSEALRKRLSDLEAVMMSEKGVLRVQQFASPVFDGWKEDGIVFKADRRFADLKKKIDRANAMEFPVPTTLRAELREYQVVGFEWLARLNEWGAGGCLADDMGLGKTVQTIAMLLRLAKEGAALVICPASVLPNWKRELERFAPSLRVNVLNMTADRESMVREAAAFDVVLSTYGLLVTEEKILTEREWRSVVLDEAHTIKNRDTKMSKSAMCLQGGFRLILTGTPVQNHLGEIWNLFQFINPGLLGSLEGFTERFITPIVQYKDKGRQKRLKQLLSPFLLRRTKSAVLDELPPKTEALIEVALSEAELAAYELLRRQAELMLEESAPGEQIKMLAEITRLRMAACNLNLVNTDFTMASSKMETFLSIVDELRENNHRALVFSQFTSHLSLIRKELEQRAIPYLYLDGSTPIPQREKLVDEFQTGDCSLFLVSLKAGGLGLNLTAADFVIHMDPWWNPAVEDQATDRAHRIGQTHPVTVYRLIAKGTIEEKILRLHHTKKDMADSLLEGTDVASGLTRDDLLDLLRDD